MARGVYDRTPERDALFETISGHPIEPLYTEEDLEGFDPAEKLGHPGEHPFTRGIYPSMYRGRLWTMRQFAGFGTVEETNERFRYLLDHGQHGLSTAFDMPTLMGLDSDHGRSLGEVGVEGVALDTVDDMETLFDGIPLDEVTVSMTINAPAAILLAFYVVAAEENGIPADRLGGTIQTDILKEYIAQKEWCFPIEPAMRLVTDMVEWCSTRCRAGTRSRSPATTSARPARPPSRSSRSRSRTASPTSSGRSSAGSTSTTSRPRLSFFFNAHIDFFEEIAKYRAARRIWAREMRDTYGARDERSQMMRFHTQTAGVSLTAQQPLVNIVRTTIEALAGVLGGTQSLHTNSYDEALALPTEEAVRVALRTQQVIAHESGRHQHRRPARRRLLHREAHRRDGGRRLRLLRPHRRARRDGRGDQDRLSRSARSPTPPSATSARSTPASGSSSGVNALPARRRADARAASPRPGGRAPPGATGWRRPGRRATTPPSRRRSPASRRAAAAEART